MEKQMSNTSIKQVQLLIKRFWEQSKYFIYLNIIELPYLSNLLFPPVKTAYINQDQNTYLNSLGYLASNVETLLSLYKKRKAWLSFDQQPCLNLYKKRKHGS
jgi:hypothetical protein